MGLNITIRKLSKILPFTSRHSLAYNFIMMEFEDVFFLK